MENQHELEAAGCDWLTMTWHASDERQSHLKLAVSGRMEELQTGGSKAKEARRMQYQGIRAGKLFFGRDDTHFYLEATSHEANETAKRLIAGNLGGKATRTDLQATYSYPQRSETFFQEFRDRIGRSDSSGEKRRAQTGAHYFAPLRDTGVSLGSKHNERNFRAYSAREGGHPEHSENAIRFEEQLRHARARQAWELMENAPDLPMLAVGVVTNELRAVGIHEPWMDKVLPQRLAPLKNKRDIDSAFKWYREQIFPSFAKTINEGYGEQLLNELQHAIDTALENSCQPLALEFDSYKKLFGE
jgi:hypothetical protein